MSDYTRDILKVVVAKICQTIGWHNIQSTSLEIMTDILRRYLSEITKLTHAYSNQFGHTQPNLDELGLALRDMNVNIADLEEFVRYVDTGVALEVPQFPIKKESHLNFLKPGSDEVITRSVHIHEHLPPMLPNNEDAEPSCSFPVVVEESQSAPNMDAGAAIFKRPADISPNELPMKRPRLIIEEEGRPTREISSVMMTTSGFLSPAREGKLPESRTPVNAIDTPNTSISHSNNNLDNESKFEKKPAKVIKKTDKRKDKLSKELFKPFDEMMPKKTTMKDVVKMKQMKANAAHQNLLNSGPQLFDPTPIKTITPKATPVTPKQNKSQQKHIKNDKLIAPTTPTPPVAPKIASQTDKVVEGKVSSESNKLKLNIFKKISKVKEDKVEKVEKAKVKDDPRSGDRIPQESRESSPDLIIDESDNMKNWDSKTANSKPLDLVVKQEPPEQKPSKAATNMEMVSKMFEMVKSPHSDKSFLYDDDISPPGTPSTPKTPEMPSHSPPLKIEKEIKRKRKDKGKTKNKSKMPKYSMSPRRNKLEHFDTELDRPKTPDGISIVKEDPPIIMPPQPTVPPFSFFQNYIPGPGLIPTPIGMPMFPRMPIAGGRPNHGFGQPAHIPQAMPALPFVPPVKVTEEHIDKSPTPVVQEPVKPEKSEVPIVGTKEKHKKDKKDKIKKKNKKDKIKNKSEKRKLKEEKKEQKEKDKSKKEKKKKEKDREHEGSVPKLTLKIGSPRPPTPDVQLQRKILIKPVVKKEEDPPVPITSSSVEVQDKREPSPELARISALITRPPKPKVATTGLDKSPRHLVSSNDSPSAPNAPHAKIKKSIFKVVPKLKNRKVKGGPEVEVDSKIDIQIPNVPVSAPAAFYFDNDGNKVWICPACGRQDDGSPMIGCDDCDAWYHWVCVGIQVPPDDSEDWYCRICILAKQETMQIDKKKKRKKKERKEHS